MEIGGSLEITLTVPLITKRREKSTFGYFIKQKKTEKNMKGYLASWEGMYSRRKQKRT